jgi:hypothetical protein
MRASPSSSTPNHVSTSHQPWHWVGLLLVLGLLLMV